MKVKKKKPDISGFMFYVFLAASKIINTGNRIMNKIISNMLLFSFVLDIVIIYNTVYVLF